MVHEQRALRPGDEATVFAFLERYLVSSLFLVSNIERGGLEDQGLRYQGTYVANFADGTMTAVAGHSWSGILLLQGDAGLEQAAERAVLESGRAVRGLIGPLELVRRVRIALKLTGRPTAHETPEILFALDLVDLAVPELLSESGVQCRHPTEAEVEATLTGWRLAYMSEALDAVATPELERDTLQQLESARRDETIWVLVRDRELLAMTAFNASARGFVQVGGVYTPPPLRCRGYSRAAVAGSLLAARQRGAKTSVLFTNENNVAAIRAYMSLGYRAIGDWGLVLFR